MYVYIRSEPDLHTVGYYKPDGQWAAESDHNSPESAAARVSYLNGGQLLIEISKETITHINRDLLAVCERIAELTDGSFSPKDQLANLEEIGLQARTAITKAKEETP